MPTVTQLFVCISTVLSNEGDDRRRERNRRNSDSVVYVKPEENVALALKQAEIQFLQEKMNRLEIENDKLSEASAGKNNFSE